MDAVFSLLDAMRLFRGKSLQEIQEITFEIGMLGKYGLDISIGIGDSDESHARGRSEQLLATLKLSH